MKSKRANLGNRMSEKDYDIRLNQTCKSTGHSIIRIGPYSGSGKNTEHKCLKCNHIWSPRPYNLVNAKSGCPKCSVRTKIQPFRVMKAKVEKVNPNIQALSRCSKTNSRFRFKCRLCAHEWEAPTQNVLRGTGCPNCSGRIAYSQDLVIQRSQKKFGLFLDYSLVPQKLGPHDYIDLGCPVHGEFKVRACDHLNKSKFPCPKCALDHQTKNQTFTREEFIARSKSLFGSTFKYKKLKYTGLHSYLTLTCRKHGDFDLLGYNHLHSGSGCPKCSNVESKPHRRLRDALESKGIRCQTNVRKIIKGLEIDLYLPEHKLGIEINGVYWHSDQRKTKDYHYNKTLACKKKGITLLHFWDYEVNTKFDLVMSMIRARVGKNKRLFARKCQVKKLNSKEARDFLERNHIQGADKSSVYLGLLHENTLVAVASFAKPRFDTTASWELVRLASHKGITVVGGASRLLSEFRQNHTGSIVSYANLRYSQGKVYKELGFSYSHRTSPNYEWIKGQERYSRYQSQKHKLERILANFSLQKSETENMRDNGFLRVYDCGNLVYILEDIP